MTSKRGAGKGGRGIDGFLDHRKERIEGIGDMAFGFTVKRTEAHAFGSEHFAAGWSVSLPHQCDSWDIAGDDGYVGVPQEEAVAELESFIAEAQTALAALREHRELIPVDESL